MTNPSIFKNRNSFVFVFLSVALLISILTKSRAFFLGYTVSFLFILLIFFNKRLNRSQIILITVFTLLLFYILIFLIKPDSSLGRLLIYKISWQIFEESWFSGIGLGKFKVTYMYYQAEYFKHGDYNTKELLLADNTYFAFNDYFQFIIEMGIVGIFIILVAFFSFTILIRKAWQLNSKNSFILNCAFCHLLALLIAAFFSYAFHVLIHQLSFLLSTLIVSLYVARSQFHKLSVILVFIFLTIILLSIPYQFSYQVYVDLRSLNEIKTIYRAGFKSEARDRLNELSGSLHDNAKYQELLSDMLITERKYLAGEAAIHSLLKKSVSNNLYLRLGNLYASMAKNQQAEASYLMAINMVPNRFLPRYDLYNFYKKTGQSNKAIHYAKNILKLPVKIPSYTIMRVRQQLINDLKIPSTIK